jgi:hypothetical protein
MQIAKAKLKPGQHRAVLSDGGNLYLELTRLADDRIGKYFSSLRASKTCCGRKTKIWKYFGRRMACNNK